MRPKTGSYPESSATRGSANSATARRTESICAFAFALSPGFGDCAWRSIGAAATMLSQGTTRGWRLDMPNPTPTGVGCGGRANAAHRNACDPPPTTSVSYTHLTLPTSDLV